ncbi:MAG TPA: FlgD immunoglobulin-like domain containing protein [Fimbriimonadaceae bacterium]|nr:FlgD immunoglobulin-like domain containing protein [Fimbriimonadaceae bacterium]
MLPKLGYITHSAGGRPPQTERRFDRRLNPNGFPQVMDFYFGQTSAFGMRIEQGPTPATTDNSGQSGATEVQELALGNSFFSGSGGLLGFWTADSNFPDSMFPPVDPNDPDKASDVRMNDRTAFIQKFAEQPVPSGGSRRITHYIRMPWGNSNYTAPYAAVVDAPRLVAEDLNGGPGSANNLRPNPLPIRVYVDNVGGYATIDREIPLSSVRVTLSLSEGLELAPGEVAVKTIASVPAREIRFVDFLVEADGVAVGDLPYSVKIEPVPGPTKILNGSIRVASTPRILINADANLITAPWTFSDTSWETILSPLVSPADFQAFVWDPEQQGYIVSTSVERGKAAWIIANSAQGSLALGGNPQRPADTAVGGHSIQLKSGWNLIGNPYNYAIKVGEIVGVSAASPQQSYPWQQLVNQGVVGGALVYYDNETQDYVFTQGLDAAMHPNRGYWVFVGTAQDVTLSFPAVYAEFLPGSSRRQEEGRWVQSDKQWRLNLVARTNKSLDAQNYVGAARNATEANKLRMVEPPMTPVHNVGFAIQETVNGQSRSYAQSLSEKAGRKEWKAIVTATEAGTVSLSWPNISTVPKNVRFRITDLATGASRDLRQISGYSFEAAADSTREFKIEAIPGGVSQVVIGAVNVSKAGRDAMAPFTINYTLSADATTTVRILSGSGKEVFTIARGRADKAGENAATWALRDNANRAVAPGAYRVEILAETPSGERVRRIVPINVIR